MLSHCQCCSLQHEKNCMRCVSSVSIPMTSFCILSYVASVKVGGQHAPCSKQLQFSCTQLLVWKMMQTKLASIWKPVA